MKAEKLKERTVVVQSDGAGEPEYRERTRWNPSPEEFQRYLDREIAMCKEKLHHLSARMLSECSLHSFLTISRATENVEEQRRAL